MSRLASSPSANQLPSAGSVRRNADPVDSKIVDWQVNGSVVRVGILQGEYHWHKHDHDDEFFFVLEGKLFVDLEDRTVELMRLH